MPNTAPIIVGIGEILWDMLPAGRQLGGAPANFAYHAGALGGQGVVVSRVGDDSLGREILQRLEMLGLDRSHVRIDRLHPTGTVDVRLDSEGVPEYVIHTNVAWDHLSADARAIELAHKANAVCYGTLGQRAEDSRQAIGAFLAAVDAGCLRIFDINLRQNYYSAELIEQLLKQSHVLKLNDAELPVVAELLGLRAEGPAGVADQLLRRFSLRLIALTRGPHGSVLYSRQGEVDEHPGVSGPVQDTVGAGDAFTAALALGLLQDRPLPRINAFANRVAAYVCSASGATPTIPEDLVRSA